MADKAAMDEVATAFHKAMELAEKYDFPAVCAIGCPNDDVMAVEGGVSCTTQGDLLRFLHGLVRTYNELEARGQTEPTTCPGCDAALGRIYGVLTRWLKACGEPIPLAPVPSTN